MRWLGAVISLSLAAAPVFAETAAPVQPDPNASALSGTRSPPQESTAAPARSPREELLVARRAISEGHIAEAQDSLGRAVTGLRSSPGPHGRNRSAEAASHRRAAAQASEARQVLQAGHRKRALKLVDGALSRLNIQAAPPTGKPHPHPAAS